MRTIIPQGFRELEEGDILQAGDELAYEYWASVVPEQMREWSAIGERNFGHVLISKPEGQEDELLPNEYNIKGWIVIRPIV